MQEQEILTVIDSLYATFLRDDLNAVIDLVSDNTEWIVYEPAELPFTGEFRGPSGVKRFLEALLTTQEEVKVESVTESPKETKPSLLRLILPRSPPLVGCCRSCSPISGLSKAAKSQN
jgi:hypothetical protein